jgi:ketosteroid isomerase-like protein
MATPRRLETDEDEVLSANRTFYEALQSLDLAGMEEVWLAEDWVLCLHPGWELLIGWEDIHKSWSEIFRSTAQMMIAIGRPLVRVSGDMAWVSCLENVTSAHSDGFATAVVEATNIFVRRDGRWWMVHHHTTPLPGRVPPGTSSTVQ